MRRWNTSAWAARIKSLCSLRGGLTTPRSAIGTTNSNNGREDVAKHGSSRDEFPLQQPRPGAFIKESVLGVRSVEGNGAEQHGRGMSKSAGLEG